MTDSVHGHEVLHLVLDAPQPPTLEALEAQVRARFGADARFHTCSASGLTFAELIDFLQLRGKLVPSGGGVVADRGQICDG
jgi:probable metal-binding protein